MKIPRNLLICLLIFTALIAINFFAGAVEDNDGYKIIKRALTAPWYTQSRTWGFPAYEIVAYPIIYYAGLTATKFYSFVFATGSIIVFWAILTKITTDDVKLFWGTLAFVLLPVTMISGNSVMETSQGLFLALAGVLLYLRFERERKSRDFLLMALTLGLATATRPDYIVLSGCVALVVLLFARPSLKLIVLGTVVWAAAALLPYTIYAISRVQFGVILPEPLWRKTARTVLGYLALFGIPAVVVIVAWLASHRRSFERVPAHLWAFFGLTLALYSARYVMLPDELEYVHLIVPLVVMMLVALGMSGRALAVLAIAIFVPNLVQVHFFDRDTQTGELQAAFGVSPGAIVQDREKRLMLEYANGELVELFEQVAGSYGFTTWDIEPEGRVTGILIIMPVEGLRYYQPDRLDGRYYHAGCQQTIVTYPMPYERGWRQFIAYEPWSKVELSDFTKVVFPHCT